MFDYVDLSEVLKWVALIFAAGFVGFFGKALARAVLSLFRKEKKAGPPVPAPSGDSPPSRNGRSIGDVRQKEPVAGTPEKDERKIAKKALKVRQKEMKKQGKK